MLSSWSRSNAQNPQLNEDKYWDYRDRLRNEFMIGIGPEMGQSIPASVRDTVSGILQWTDCTIAHGQYLAILATEYRILENQGENTDATVEELFYALYALNRLDYKAEAFFGGTPSLNGFFIRDDISMDSLDLDSVLAHLNQGLPEQKISLLDSDYMDEIPRNNEESLDQAILLLTGLGMVSRFLPEEVVYTSGAEVQEFQDFETSLKRESVNIITRMVNYMKEGDSSTVILDPGDPNLYGIQGDAWDFIIKNPVTYEPVLRGENAYLLSKGYTSAKYHFTGLLSETTDTAHSQLADSIFLMFEDYIIPNDQDFKLINLNAMANFWPEGLQADSSNYQYNARVLGPRSKDQDYEWIPMLHQLVFGGQENYLMSAVPPDTPFYNDPGGYYEDLLNQAPPEGPYNYGNGNYPNFEWSSTSRTIQPGRRGESGNAFPGNYPGLDYMLYYNFYRILYQDPVGTTEREIPDLLVYPNPFRDHIHIRGDLGPAPLDYEIIRLDGRLLKKGRVLNSSIRAAEIPNGLYLLKISNSEYQISTRIIKYNY